MVNEGADTKGVGNASEECLRDAATGELIDCVDDAIVVLTADLGVVYANKAALDLMGTTGDGDQSPTLDPSAVAELVVAEDLDIAADALEAAMRDGRAVARVSLDLPTGTRPVEVSLTDRRETPGIGGIVACFRNLEQEHALATSLERQRLLTEYSTVLEAQLSDRHVMLKRLVEVQSSISAFESTDQLGEALARGVVALFGGGAAEVCLRDGRQGKRFYEYGAIDSEGAADGDAETFVATITDGAERLGTLNAVVTVEDHLRSTGQELLEILAEHSAKTIQSAGARDRAVEAMTDHLTGLPMRRLFLDRLEECLRLAEQEGFPVSVFFVDLDGFKDVNDALGHTAGDVMLRSTAARLRALRSDVSNWGRIGGDEFVYFGVDCDTEEAQGIAAQISQALRQPMALGGRSFFTSASVGIATIPAGPVSAEAAVRRADIAMYEGKRSGRNLITVFEPDMEQRVVGRAELEGQFRRSLLGAGPDVVFQPIVNLETGETVAVEALARWASPTRGPISPEEFVAMAEEIGIVDQLDRHVLRKAAKAVRDVCDSVSGKPLRLSVNASIIHLASDHFTDELLRTISEADFPAERLVVEVTESRAVEDNDVLRGHLKQLRAEGIRIALDDFGTGHSSLAQLEQLEIDFLKIDKMFLDGVPDSPRRVRYVETIVAMAHALGITVLFEGIETEPQRDLLASLRVPLGQGYLLARPSAIEALPQAIRQASLNAGVPLAGV